MTLKNVFVDLVILLILTVNFYSCTENKNLEAENGEVPYKSCLCPEEKPLYGIFPQGVAYLFRDSTPEQMMNNIYAEIINKAHRVYWVVYHSKTEQAVMYSRDVEDGLGSGILYSGRICNFPDFAKKWIIPKNGCMVEFEGLTYEHCGVGIHTQININYVLTSLKRIEK